MTHFDDARMYIYIYIYVMNVVKIGFRCYWYVMVDDIVMESSDENKRCSFEDNDDEYM